MPMWRTDRRRRHSGINPAGHRRELVSSMRSPSSAGRMQPSSKSIPTANLLNGEPLHRRAPAQGGRGYKMAPFPIVMQVIKGQLCQYVELHGTECIAPARKNPLTNALILKARYSPSPRVPRTVGLG